MGQVSKTMYVSPSGCWQRVPWLLTTAAAGKDVWIDETTTVGHDQSSPESGAEDFDTDLLNYAASPELTSPELTSPGGATAPPSATLSQESSVPPESRHSPSDLAIVTRFAVDGHQSAVEEQPFAVQPSLLGVEEPSKWPLPQGTEGHLIRHFVENLALWLDLCDPNRMCAVTLSIPVLVSSAKQKLTPENRIIPD